jgi:hypothetical protein
MSQEIETLSDFNRLVREVLDKKDKRVAEDLAAWENNSSERKLALVEIMLERAKVLAMEELLIGGARGMVHIRLREKIQQSQQRLRKMESTRRATLRLQIDRLEDCRCEDIKKIITKEVDAIHSKVRKSILLTPIEDLFQIK